MISLRDGTIELILSKADDPDACVAEIPLSYDEAGALANLLGAPQLVTQLAEEHRDLPGIRTKQLPVNEGSPFDGRPLGETAMRTRTGVSLVAVMRAGQVHPSPGPDFTLAAGAPGRRGPPGQPRVRISTTLTKLATGWWAARQQGIGPLGRARTGAALVARGEFSIVIAGLALASGAVVAELAALATTYVLLMAVLGPIAARVVEPVA